ncbi:unnamed protein product [Rotaria sp. Silwood2]|nr:unnamed protein product [Rotaria sp. Silwood2]
MEQRNILPEHQAGFRPRKSTLNNIIRLTKYARNNLEQNGRRRHSAVILFDIKAAFDSVWHDGLIYKLNELRIPKYLMYYLISFLQNRTASIEIENSLSKLFHLNSGTPQGSPLSPLLYIIYTADSMNGLPEHTQYGLFADDTALWTSSNTTSSLSSRLQQASDAFQSWCKSWKLKLQPTKTELVHFTLHPRRKFKNPVSVKIDNYNEVMNEIKSGKKSVDISQYRHTLVTYEDENNQLLLKIPVNDYIDENDRYLKDIGEFVIDVGNEILELTKRKRKMQGKRFELKKSNIN